MAFYDYKPPSTVARETTERGEIVLRHRQNNVFELIVNGVFLMATDNSVSAKELAYKSLDVLEKQSEISVLIGGLGLGYTLAAALERPGVSTVDVVEIERYIVDWANIYYPEIHDHALDNPKTNVIIDDLVQYVQNCESVYDAILLDIDNGPTWLVSDSNPALYEIPLLKRLKAMLTPGGVLGIWGSESSPPFLSCLRSIFPKTEEVIVIDTVDHHELEHVIYIAC